MALTPLTWRMLPPVTVTTPNSIHTLLDAIYAAGTSSVYVDGENRTVSINTKWNWFLDNTATPNTGSTTAVYATPPAVGSAMGQKIIVCGSVAAPASTLRYQKEATTYVVSRPLVGIAKSAGTYTHWTDAVSSSGTSTPFTSGEFSGYATTGDLGTAAYATVYMYESQEAIAVFAVVAGIVRMAFVAGAFIDCFSTNTLNVETDGRIYGLTSLRQITGGMDASFLSTAATSNPLFNGNGTVLNANCFFFTPGLATTRNSSRLTSFASSFGTFTAPNGNIPLVPIQLNYQASGNYAGQLREIFATRPGILDNTVTDGTTVKGYLAGYSSTTSGHAILFKK
jgi:hypothetical protein